MLHSHSSMGLPHFVQNDPALFCFGCFGYCCGCCCGCCSDENGDEDDEDIEEFAETMAELVSHIHSIFGNDVTFHIVID